MMINTTQELNDIFKQAIKATHIAFDTEFIRKKGKYYPEPSLIQFSFDGKNGYIIDLLNTNINLQPIIEILQSDTLKIFHSIKQDLHVIYKVFQIIPCNIFDIQIAAMFFSQYINPGYNTLIKDFLNITLNKNLQFSNWLKRPLHDEQIQYAANDVIYLYQVFPIIKHALKHKYMWAIEEMNKLLLTETISKTQLMLEKLAFKMICTNKYITPEYLWLLKLALEWREKESLIHNQLQEQIFDSIALCEFIYKFYNKKTFNSISSNVFKERLYKLISTAIQPNSFDEYEKLITILVHKKRVIHKKPKTYYDLKNLLKDNSILYDVHHNLIARKEDIINMITFNSLTKKFTDGWRYIVFGCNAQQILTFE